MITVTRARHVVAALILVTCVTAVRADEALEVGAAMEDLGLRELDVASGKVGRIVWLSDFVGQGSGPRKKLLLLSFFASWCKPCLAELPQLQQLQARYAARGLQVLSVHVRTPDQPFEAVLDATRRLLPAAGPGFPVLFERFTNRAQLIYMGSAASLPCNVLIDGAGRIAARLEGADASHSLEARIRTQLDARGAP